MTRHEIHAKVIELTNEVYSTNVAQEIFAAAFTDEPSEVQKVFDSFEAENPELYQKLVDFGEEFNQAHEEGETGHECAVFHIEADEENGIFVFDTDEIDSLSLYALTFFAKIDELFLFVDPDAFVDNTVESRNAFETEDDTDDVQYALDKFEDALEEAVNYDLAEFVANASWINYVGEGEDFETLPELLVAVVNGKCRDWF